MFKLFDYLFTPKDAWNGVMSIFARMRARDWLGVAAGVGLALVLRILGHAGVEAILFLLFIFILFYWRLEGRISFIFALACLVLIPILLILFNQNVLLMGEVWAEKVAVWAYYFLVIGTVKQIVEYVSENRKKQKWVQKMRNAKQRKMETRLHSRRRALAVDSVQRVSK